MLHDLAREAIDADLRWRDRAAYTRVHALVRRDVVERLLTCEGREHQRALADLMFLHRGNPAAPAFWEWESLGDVYADALRPGDAEAVVAMVERHEGAESAAIAAHWLRAPARGFDVVRGREPEPLGFLAHVSLHEASEKDLAQTPGAAAACGRTPTQHAALRPGDEVLCGRFYMDRDAYQAPSRSFNVVTMRSTQEWLMRPAAVLVLHRLRGSRRARAADGLHRLWARAVGRLRGRRAAPRRLRARLAPRRTRWPGSSG